LSDGDGQNAGYDTVLKEAFKEVIMDRGQEEGLPDRGKWLSGVVEGRQRDSGVLLEDD
jgi:hypothetical protein